MSEVKVFNRYGCLLCVFNDELGISLIKDQMLIAIVHYLSFLFIDQIKNKGIPIQVGSYTLCVSCDYSKNDVLQKLQKNYFDDANCQLFSFSKPIVFFQEYKVTF